MSTAIRALAVLLGYPSADLQAHIGEVRNALCSLPRHSLARIEPLLARIEREDLLELQAAYSDLFERSRQLSLHLFEHVHGDGRERGQAMIDLGQQYAEDGFLLDSTELPDFVPVFLEYVSCLAPRDAREMLGQPVHVFAALAERLDRRQSDYAGIFHALVALAGTRPSAEALAELDARTPDEDPSRLDEEWEEAPVTFLASGAHEMGGPTGLVARIRAGNRRVAKEAER